MAESRYRHFRDPACRCGRRRALARIGDCRPSLPDSAEQLGSKRREVETVDLVPGKEARVQCFVPVWAQNPATDDALERSCDVAGLIAVGVSDAKARTAEHSNESTRFNIEPGLFPHLALDGLFRRLTRFDTASRHGPAPVVFGVDEEETTVGVDGNSRNAGKLKERVADRRTKFANDSRRWHRGPVYRRKTHHCLSGRAAVAANRTSGSIHQIMPRSHTASPGLEPSSLAASRHGAADLVTKTLDPVLVPLGFAPGQVGADRERGQVIFCRGEVDSADGGCVDLVVDVEAAPDWQVIDVRYWGFPSERWHLDVARGARLADQLADLAQLLPIELGQGKA